jgi:hypothetical protein
VDGSRFDTFTRSLATRQSRRVAVRTLLTGAGGAALAIFGIGDGASAEGCKQSGKACSKGNQCCSGNCAPPTGKKSVAKSSSICCPVGQVQQADGTCGCPVSGCICPSGYIDCGQGCIPGNCCTNIGCNDSITCTIDQCVNNVCVNTAQICPPTSCQNGFCHLEAGRCVYLEIGGNGDNGLCHSGEFYPDGQPVYEFGPGICESQYADADGFCAPNPNPCTKHGLACTAEDECCFGFACILGYCWDGIV